VFAHPVGGEGRQVVAPAVVDAQQQAVVHHPQRLQQRAVRLQLLRQPKLTIVILLITLPVQQLQAQILQLICWLPRVANTRRQANKLVVTYRSLHSHTLIFDSYWHIGMSKEQDNS